MIPSTLYQSKFVHILHTVCEEIVSEDIQREPILIKEVLHYEDKALRNKHVRATRKY